MQVKNRRLITLWDRKDEIVGNYRDWYNGLDPDKALDAKKIENADEILTPIINRFENADGDAVISYGMSMIIINNKYRCFENSKFPHGISRVQSLKRMPAVVLLAALLFVPFLSYSQSHNYWTRSFNEESSLLSGAVVGGGAGPSAIYYNPASISEITASSFSFHTSLFSFEFIDIKNALGDGINLSSSRGTIEPRFVSYMLQPKNNPDLSFEFAFLNNENFHQQFARSVDKEIDILTNLPGVERYFALFNYSNRYRDDWFGVGSSWKINPRLSMGASMFITVKQSRYQYSLDIEAYPILDSSYLGDDYSFYSANSQENEIIKFNDYRLLWKFGMLYKHDRFSFGLSLTTPSVGGIYSDGKQVSRKQKQSNISFTETGVPLPDYVVVDYKEKKEVMVNAKSPLSIAVGFTYYLVENSHIIYSSLEYFSGIDPYRLVQADESPNIISGSVLHLIDNNEWLTFVGGAKPLLNAAIGYRWNVKENVMMMAGFRTDFNYRKDINYSPMPGIKKVKGLDLDLYHFSTGLSWNILGQDLITGFQYTIGKEKNQEQFANLSNPVEFNTEELVPLQGTRQNTMDTFLKSISLYFGATINFK